MDQAGVIRGELSRCARLARWRRDAEPRSARGARTWGTPPPSTLSPAPTFAPRLARGAVIAVIVWHHPPVISVAQRREQARPTLGLSSPLTATMAVPVTAARVQGVSRRPGCKGGGAVQAGGCRHTPTTRPTSPRSGDGRTSPCRGSGPWLAARRSPDVPVNPGGAHEPRRHARIVPCPLEMTFRAMKSARLTTAAEVLRGIAAEITPHQYPWHRLCSEGWRCCCGR
jgi:hypothetical protein